MVYGYLRVSADDQNEARQLDAMLSLGIARECLFLDRCSGRDFDRPAYRRLLARLRPGDCIAVKSIDRLGRNYREIMEQWREIVEVRGVDIRVLDMPLLDTAQRHDLIGTLISDIVLQLLSFVAESERENIRRRQAEGIAAARRRGVHLGRPAPKLPQSFLQARARFEAGDLSVTEAARMANMSRSGFYYHARIKPHKNTADLQKMQEAPR